MPTLSVMLAVTTIVSPAVAIFCDTLMDDESTVGFVISTDSTFVPTSKISLMGTMVTSEWVHSRAVSTPL